MKLLPCIFFACLALGQARELNQALTLAAGNKVELDNALAKVPAEQKKALEFLIRHMPERDLKSLKADFLTENLHLAFQARKQFPWGKRISDDVFFNDVLPYAVLNEKREAWRADFKKRFTPIVKDKKTIEEAVKAITAIIGKEVKVKYSTKRKKADQSPSESIEQGLASCTGLSILLVDACRAVGIPARVAGTPAWTTKRGNHNWVEIFTPADGKWHFTEYYANKKGFDHSWFVADASQANAKSKFHSIYASSWKSTPQHFPLVWDMSITYVPGVNVTETYVKLGKGKDLAKLQCELRVDVFNKKGERAETDVTIVQGSASMGNGNSPKVTDDMNKFLTIPLKKGQLYHAIWKDPDTGVKNHVEFKTPNDKTWHQLSLKSQVPKAKK